MGERLANGRNLQALLANSFATGAALIALIAALGPISGAHFNPAISLHAAMQRSLPWREVLPYVGGQLAGGLAGVGVANAMFGLPLLFSSHHDRHGMGLLLGEFVATFGLIIVVSCCARFRKDLLPLSVGAYITVAILFTSSAAFANPVVALARSLSDTFTGISPRDVPPFVLAQLAGAAAATVCVRWFGSSR